MVFKQYKKFYKMTLILINIKISLDLAICHLLIRNFNLFRYEAINDFE